MVSVTIPLPEGGDLRENVSVSTERGAAREGEVVEDLSLSAPLETRSWSRMTRSALHRSSPSPAATRLSRTRLWSRRRGRTRVRVRRRDRVRYPDVHRCVDERAGCIVCRGACRRGAGRYRGVSPGSLSIEDVTAGVESSKTVHRVRRQPGLDVEETRDVLCRLNLLVLVTGRLATRPDGDPTAGEITDRFRTALSG